jgi:hypothetical protein
MYVRMCVCVCISVYVCACVVVSVCVCMCACVSDKNALKHNLNPPNHTHPPTYTSHKDRRKLTSCPILEGEERLRLLNYQNNYITKVENLDNLPNLYIHTHTHTHIHTHTHTHTHILYRLKISTIFRTSFS